MPQKDLNDFAAEIQELGRQARIDVGVADVNLLKRLLTVSRISELAGRLVLQFATGPWGWIAGVIPLSFHLSLEAQLNHSIMHGAYDGLPDAEEFSPKVYETLALPFQSRTWGDAHRIHHGNPSLLEKDPDTVHPFFRVHEKRPWRPWNLFNTFWGAIFVFECWAFDYDRFLKNSNLRPKNDKSEIRKFLLFLGYQYVLFPVLAGRHWKQVLLANIAAVIIRNFVFTALQTASSVGHGVSTLHPEYFGKKNKGEWHRFQVETSKNFGLKGAWKTICGGLDRHIEHHLFPRLPPNRLHELSFRVRELCETYNVEYSEFTSIWGSLGDSVSYLAKLSVPKIKSKNKTISH